MIKDKRIILVGPAGAGKTFISNKFRTAGYKEEISYTSRPIRLGEINGIDYNFVSKEEFLDMISTDELYEWAKHGDYFYGTRNEDFYNSDIFVWETEGVSKLKPLDRANSIIIFVNTPMNIRVKRMKERGWDLYDIYKRLKTDRIKFKSFNDFDLEIHS